MRVIAGKAKRLQLMSPQGYDTRPTTDKIKETFERIVKLDKDSYSQMRMMARRDAELFFDYRNYLKGVEEFLKWMI